VEEQASADLKNDEALLDKEDQEESKTAPVETTKITEPEAEDQEEVVEPHNKFMLLDRLLKFIRSKDKPLTAVLAGYFSKLMTLLINRK